MSVHSFYKPKYKTPLYHWMQKNKVSAYRLGKSSGVHPAMVVRYMYGQVIPSVVAALKIELTTNGGVTVKSWLETPLCKARWVRRSVRS